MAFDNIRASMKQQPGRYAELAVDPEAGTVNQSFFAGKGIERVEFPKMSVRETVKANANPKMGKNGPVIKPFSSPNNPPSDIAPKDSTKARLYAKAQFQMLGNADALLAHARRSGRFDDWGAFYFEGNQTGKEMGKMYGVGHRVAHGVLAALSGNGTDWTTANVPNAHKVLHAVTQENRVPKPEELTNGESARINNAVRIIKGEDPETVLGTLKEGNFFKNLHNPEGDEITVDTHMGYGLTGWKRNWLGAGGGAPYLQQPTVYNMFDRIVRDASEANNLSPSVGQAVMWGAVKDLYNMKSGSPAPEHERFGEYYDVKDPRFPQNIRTRQKHIQSFVEGTSK